MGLVCGCRRSSAGGPLACAAMLLAALAAVAADDAPTLDPMQQAVVDSLDIPGRTFPADLLEAAIRAADVEADAAAAEAFERLGAALAAAGDGLPDLLADLGDSFDAASLGRLDRVLASREPRAREVIGAIRDAAALRRRDPRRLAAAGAALASASARERRAAVEALARAGVDALPALIEVIGGTDDPRARELALALVRDLGPAARQPLIAWLASDDVDRWPPVIEALAATRPLGDDAAFLLAPAAVADSPPAARTAALAALGLDQPPAAATAAAGVAARLDRLLAPAGLAEPDHLLLEPVTDPAGAAAAYGGSVTGSVERWLWNPQARRIQRSRLPPRAARALEAGHLARDLAALGDRDPAAVRLVLLAQLENLLVSAGEPTTAVERIGLERLRAALSPPAGFVAETAADILDLAVERGLWEAAAAAACALEPPTDASLEGPLPVAARKPLVRALAVPDPTVQFAAARTLALAAGDPPWPGSSRVVEILAHAATAADADVAVVAHPDVDVAHSLASGVARFGFRPVLAATGRDAILAARASADTVLVILAARLVRPTALETVEFLRHQGTGGEPPVLVVVDPLDDDGRGCFLQQLILKFRDASGVAIVDGLDSFFAGVRDADTGELVLPPRFHDALARCAGPAAVDPAARTAVRTARAARAREALALLARLGRRVQDVSAALDTARLSLVDPDRADAATTLLAAIGRPAAQRALAAEAARAEVAPATRDLALAAFAVSRQRYGLLLGRSDVETLLVNYTHDPDAAVRKASAAIIDVIETPRTIPASAPLDVAPARPR
ncbi:MAG: hypothetical protein ACKON7_00470 [Planctomycetaceae bacterium]